jgi:flavin reductase (DIM6/NTAB) family NADH-FMN oxidoreductase RutF
MKKSFGSIPLAFPAPVWCIGSYDKEGKPNIMTVAWGGICCSKPACMTISLRKATYTYGCIMGRKAFTINVPSVNYVKEADYFGIASGRDVDKFLKSGLTPLRSEIVDAPYVKEFPVVLECNMIEYHELGLHTQFIGEILDIKIDESVLDEDGNPEIGKIQPIIFSPKDRDYNGIGETIGKAFEIGKNL